MVENNGKIETQIPITDKDSQEITIDIVMEGKSAYDLAVERGYEGTIDDWLNSLGTGLDASIEQAGESKTALDGSVTSAGTMKDELDGSITSATNINDTLANPVDGTIKQANDSRVALEGKITDAGTTKSEIEQAIVDNQIVKQSEFTQHKLDYVDLEEEISTARGTELTLGARLGSTDAQLNNMTQDFTQHKLEYEEQVYKIKNEVTNGDFSLGTSSYSAFRSTISVVDGKLLLKENDTNTEHYTQQILLKKHLPNEKWYARLGYVSKTDSYMRIFIPTTSHQTVTLNNANQFSAIYIVSALATSASSFIRLVGKDGVYLGTGEEYLFDNIIMVNLTETFGVGNEPTKEEMDILVEMAGGYFDSASDKVVMNWLLYKLRDTSSQEITEARISRDKLHATLNDRLLYDFKYFERYFINTQFTPTPAMTPEEMTDITKNYVYQGTASGDFWFGSWYFWDGSAWKRGGIYEPVVSTEVIIARNSNAKGKVFNNLDARLEDIEADIQALQAMGSGGTSSVKYPSPATLSATYYPTNSNIACQIKADVIIGYRFDKIVKSLDGGITWVDFASTMPNLPVNGQYVNLMDDGHLLVFGVEVATNDGIILRSSNTEFNSTTTWIEIKRITGKSFPTGNPYGMHVNGNIVLGSTYPSNSPVFLSTDYGQTFTDIFTKSITHIHHSYIDPYDKTIWVATGDGTIYRNLYYSNDYGTTWDSIWAEGTAPTQITSIISRPECVLFGSDVSEEYQIWRYDKKTKEIEKVFAGGETEISTVCSLGVTAYNQETNDGIITWLPFQAENDTKRWRLVATPDGVNYYVIDEPADLTTDKNLNSVIGTFDNKLIVRVAGNIAHYDLPEWKDL